jgi:hypothetical protein
MVHTSPLSLAFLALTVGCGGKTFAASDGGADASAGAIGPPTATAGGGSGGQPGSMPPSGSGRGSAAPPPVDQDPGMPTCSDYLDSGVNLSCMGGDCPAGEACCGCYAYSGGLAVASACAAAPCASGFQLCVTDAECLMGTCMSLPVAIAVKLCAPAADAGPASTVDGGVDGGSGDAESSEASSL